MKEAGDWSSLFQLQRHKATPRVTTGAFHVAGLDLDNKEEEEEVILLFLLRSRNGICPVFTSSWKMNCDCDTVKVVAERRCVGVFKLMQSMGPLSLLGRKQGCCRRDRCHFLRLLSPDDPS